MHNEFEIFHMHACGVAGERTIATQFLGWLLTSASMCFRCALLQHIALSTLIPDKNCIPSHRSAPNALPWHVVTNAFGQRLQSSHGDLQQGSGRIGIAIAQTSQEVSHMSRCVHVGGVVHAFGMPTISLLVQCSTALYLLKSNPIPSTSAVTRSPEGLAIQPTMPDFR